MRPTLFLLCLFIGFHAFAQKDSLKTSQVKKKFREREKRFQMSLFPGISTNGISSGFYFNKVSLNIFGGLSAGNRLIEVGGISNVNLKEANGIQVAGLANIVGANAFVNLSLSEERTLILKEDYESNYIGIQAAGMLNFVRDHATGIQTSGLLNVVGWDFHGVQVSGVGNSAGGHTGGLQLAGFYNIGNRSMTGFQVSSVFNYTRGQLTGGQVGLINKSGNVKGRKSAPPTADRGFQLGLLNFSKEMHGLQVGLLNFGGEMRGVQLGLINFFDSSPPKRYTKMGIPIALLNFGSKGSVARVSTNELFAVNVEVTTGNCHNCSSVFITEMPFYEDWKKYNQNALVWGWDPRTEQWGFGWGFERLMYNKFSMKAHRNNERKMISYGARMLHLNRERKLQRSFNMVNRFHVEYGKKRARIFWFAGLALNYFMDSRYDETDYSIYSLPISLGQIKKLNTSIWPGYNVGVQF